MPIYQVMRPGGLLMVGESESRLTVKHEFENGLPSMFKKPMPAAAHRGAPKTRSKGASRHFPARTARVGNAHSASGSAIP
jgi:hypothetical protein